MKHIIILSFFLIAVCTTGYAQKQQHSKCKLVHDKELDLDVYRDVDSSAAMLNDDSFNAVVLSKEFRFKGISKTYPEGQMVKIAYLIGTDGKASYIKVLDPKNDPEIESEAKRLIGLIPLYRPAKCGNNAVPSDARISVKLVRHYKE